MESYDSPTVELDNFSTLYVYLCSGAILCAQARKFAEQAIGIPKHHHVDESTTTKLDVVSLHISC